jgi:hypothetical protein
MRLSLKYSFSITSSITTTFPSAALSTSESFGITERSGFRKNQTNMKRKAMDAMINMDCSHEFRTAQ